MRSYRLNWLISTLSVLFIIAGGGCNSEDDPQANTDILQFRDSVFVTRDQGINTKDVSTLLSDAISDDSSAATQKDQSITQKDQSITQKDQSITQKDQSITQKDQSISMVDVKTKTDTEKKLDLILKPDSSIKTDSAPLKEAIVADHLAVAAFDKIPDAYVTAAKNNVHMYYAHTSHGNQLMVGARMLAVSPGGVYKLDAPNFISEEWNDLGSEGDTTWATTTRNVLNKSGNNYNMVMWSWCGGVEGATEANINAYLNAMEKLEQDYPNIRFVYMTGHLNSEGDNDNTDLHIRNKQIRDFCLSKKKILFDFADIESYDPAGTYYPNGKDSCEWCDTWCKTHSCPTCEEGCDHSHDFNCYIKGKAFWWMMARLAGWDGN